MTATHRPGALDTAMVSRASGRSPGQWPPTPDADELHMKAARERARRELTLGSVRASLEEQPSARSVRDCARRWVADLLGLADDVAKSKMERRT